MSTLRIERRRITAASGMTIDDAVCTTGPENCCGTVSDCLPVGYSALKVERRRLHLPPGWVLGSEWCEENAVCCPGSGDDTSCGPVVTACCPGGLPESLNLHVETNCDPVGGSCLDGDYTLTWDGSQWIFEEPIGGPFSSDNPCGVARKFTLECISAGSLLFQMWCDGNPSTSVTLTVNSCCPFDGEASWAEGNELYTHCGCNPGGSDPSGLTIGIRITGTGGGGGGGGSGSGGAECTVRVTKRRIYLPPGVTLGDAYCLDDPQGCCPTRLESCCCLPTGLPSVLYASFVNQSGSGCSCFPEVVELVGTESGNVCTFIGQVEACGVGPVESSSGLVVIVTCENNVWSATVDWIYSAIGCGSTGTVPADGVGSCDPVSQQFSSMHLTKFNTGGCGVMDQTCPDITFDLIVSE